MGFIPETIFKPLASSVVGTVGVDRSGEIIGQAVTRAAEKIGSAVIAEGAQRKRTLDIINSKALGRAYEADLDKNSTSVQSKFVDNPQAGVKKVFDANETLLNEYLEDIDDNYVKALFAVEASTVARRKNREARTWAGAQEVINASQDFTSITDTNASQLMLDPNIDKFWEYVALHKARSPLAKQIYGKNAPDAIRKGYQSMARGLLAGYERRDPHLGLKVIRSGVLNKFFNGEELLDFEKKMKTSIIGWDKSLKFENDFKVLNFFGAFDENARQKPVTTAMVDELELVLDKENLLDTRTQKEVDKLRKIAAEKTDLNSIENTEVLVKLYDELRNLQIAPDKLTAEATLTEIYNFRSNVYSASARREISKGKREMFLLQIESIKTSGLIEAGEASESTIDKVLETISGGYAIAKAAISLFGTPITPEQHGFNRVYDWLTERNFSEKIEVQAKVRILNNMMMDITELRKQEKNVTYDTIDIIVERYFREEIAKQEPSLRSLPPEGKAIQLQSGKKVLIFPSGLSIPIK